MTCIIKHVYEPMPHTVLSIIPANSLSPRQQSLNLRQRRACGLIGAWKRRLPHPVKKRRHGRTSKPRPRPRQASPFPQSSLSWRCPQKSSRTPRPHRQPMRHFVSLPILPRHWCGCRRLRRRRPMQTRPRPQPKRRPRARSPLKQPYANCRDARTSNAWSK